MGNFLEEIQYAARFVFLFTTRKRARHEVSVLQVIIHFHHRHPYKYSPNCFCHLYRTVLKNRTIIVCFPVSYTSELQKPMLHVNVLVPSSSYLSQKQANKEISLAVIICQLTVVYTTKS